MSKEYFTFSAQEAETLGIETAVVLAAAKELSTESMAEQEIVRVLQDSLIFLDNAKIAANIHRLIGLKLIKPATQESDTPPQQAQVYKLKLPSNNIAASRRKLESAWNPS
ncbi:MAG: hypothetical protein HOM10_04505, partial [Gammaproteobacteria bacterium]|nr:hypothetical protein [Gammaproteobacteria bacterium]